MDYKSMGVLISELRKQRNMTQKDLADELNVTDKAVSKWERDISCPDIHTIPKLAGILEISTEELLRFQKNVPQTEAHDGGLTFCKKVNQMSTLVLKAVGMAMGVAVLVLSVLGDIETGPAITMLSIGMVCMGIAQFQKNKGVTDMKNIGKPIRIALAHNTLLIRQPQVMPYARASRDAKSPPLR